MDVLERKECLREPSHNLLFGKACSACPGGLDLLGEIAALTIIHGDTKPARFEEGLSIPDDVGVLEGPQKLALLQCIISLLDRGAANVYHLDDRLAISISVG